MSDPAYKAKIKAALDLGVKHDDDKDPWQLMPWDALRGPAKIFAFGAKKYAPRNWEKGINHSRLFRAAIEHLVAWYQGEDLDPESKQSHLWHAGCCILMLIASQMRGIGRDDRPHMLARDEEKSREEKKIKESSDG